MTERLMNQTTRDVGSEKSRSRRRYEPAFDFQFLPVLACVLEMLCQTNDEIDQREKDKCVPKKLTKFHALSKPNISIAEYLQRIYRFADCSDDCFILALIYIDRLIKRHSCRLSLNSLTVHRLIVTAVMVAAKFCDDRYYNNKFFAAMGGVTKTEMNALEVEFLFANDFDLYVTPEVFQLYFNEICAHHLLHETKKCASYLERQSRASALPIRSSVPSAPTSSCCSSSSSASSSQSSSAVSISAVPVGSSSTMDIFLKTHHPPGSSSSSSSSIPSCSSSSSSVPFTKPADLCSSISSSSSSSDAAAASFSSSDIQKLRRLVNTSKPPQRVSNINADSTDTEIDSEEEEEEDDEGACCDEEEEEEEAEVTNEEEEEVGEDDCITPESVSVVPSAPAVQVAS